MDWKVRQMQLSLARTAARLIRLQAAKTNGRRAPSPYLTKTKFLKALSGTGGNKTQIADRLRVSWLTVQHYLKREGWEDVVEAYRAEVEKVGDLAEEAIVHAIGQRFDLNVATQNARWLLSRKRYQDRQLMDKIEVEGGGTQVNVTQNTISIDTLNLPVEVRRELLAAIEAREMRALPELVEEVNGNTPPNRV